MMKFIIPMAMLVLFTACGQSGDANSTNAGVAATGATKEEAKVVKNDAFTFEDIAGSDTKRAFRKDGKGNILEDGFMLNGKKTGMWSTYTKQYVFPKTMTSFQNGKKNGPSYAYTNHGSIELKENYVDGKLEGYWAKFKFSKPKEEAMYKNGLLHGAFREYDVKKDFLFKETMYANGKLDGSIKFMDEAGNVTMQYEYKNGKKISGGIVK